MFRNNNYRPIRRRVNLPLVIGTILVALLIILAIAGPWIAPHSPSEKFPLFIREDGEILRSPMDPFTYPEFPLGTDFIGRDTLSRILWALQPTLMLAVGIGGLRLLMGTVMGILAGWYEDTWVGSIFDALIQTAASVPVLIVALLTPGVFRLAGQFRIRIPLFDFVYITPEFNHGQFTENTLLLFIVGLSLTGWAATAQLLAERVRIIRKEDYIEASRALGARDPWILLRHVLPQVRTMLPLILSFEMSSILLQVAELGFLGFFYGPPEAVGIAEGSTGGVRIFQMAGRPELAQMLSAGWANVLLMPWVAVISGTAFFLTIFAFTLLGEGWKRRLGRSLPGRAPRFDLLQAMGLRIGQATPDAEVASARAS